MAYPRNDHKTNTSTGFQAQPQYATSKSTKTTQNLFQTKKNPSIRSRRRRREKEVVRSWKMKIETLHHDPKKRLKEGGKKE